jgi:hypothetical protein
VRLVLLLWRGPMLLQGLQAIAPPVLEQNSAPLLLVEMTITAATAWQRRKAL